MGSSGLYISVQSQQQQQRWKPGPHTQDLALHAIPGAVCHLFTCKTGLSCLHITWITGLLRGENTYLGITFRFV